MVDTWFTRALSPTGVVAELRGSVPELKDGSLGVLGCRITRVRHAGGDGRWSAVYELDVLENRSGVRRTYLTRGALAPPTDEQARPRVGTLPFGAEGWTWTAPALGVRLVALVADDALPALALVTDPERGGPVVGDLLRAGGSAAAAGELTSYRAEVVAYKPGVRATVRCRMSWADAGDGPPAVVVKVHGDEQGARAHAVLRSLTEGGAALTDRVRVARSLGYAPDLRLSVQELVEHRCTLKDLLHAGFDGDAAVWDEVVAAVGDTAAGLAMLHRRTLPVAEVVSWDAELATVRAKAARLGEATGSLGTEVAGLLARVAARAAAVPADPAVPAHHSFRAAQVLVTAGGLAFIDFDKVCRAEPAADIASFTAKLRHLAANKLGSDGSEARRDRRVMVLREAFLAAYRRNAPVSPDRVAVWEALELAALVNSAAKKLNRAWLDRCTQMLREHVNGWR